MGHKKIVNIRDIWAKIRNLFFNEFVYLLIFLFSLVIGASVLLRGFFDSFTRYPFDIIIPIILFVIVVTMGYHLSKKIK